MTSKSDKQTNMNNGRQPNSFPLAEDMAPSQMVYFTVADLEGIDPLDLDPLAETVDPDALDALFAERRRADSTCSLSFVYHGYNCTVDSDSLKLTKQTA